MLCVALLAVRATNSAEPLSAKALLSRLQSRSEPQRVAAIPKIVWRQGADAEYLAALDAIVTGGLTHSPPRESMLLAIHKLGEFEDPGAEDLLLRCLKASDWRLALAAVLALANHQSPAVVPALETAWEHPERPLHYPLAHAVVVTLSDRHSPAAVEATLELLPQLDGQLKYEALARLTRTTGKPFGGDVAAWIDWWEHANGQLPQVTTENDALPRDLKWPHALPKMCGIPIHAQRLVFVVETSQGLLGTVGGKTRLETVQDEVATAIKRLPDTTMFDLVIFNDHIDRWQPALVPADSANKAAAIQALYRQSGTGRTAMFDALEAALSLDENIEQIVFVSTGKPTAGKVIDRNVMADLILKLNVFCRTRIDTFGVATAAQGEELLKRISSKNYGDYLKVP